MAPSKDNDIIIQWEISWSFLRQLRSTKDATKLRLIVTLVLSGRDVATELYLAENHGESWGHRGSKCAVQVKLKRIETLEHTQTISNCAVMICHDCLVVWWTFDWVDCANSFTFAGCFQVTKKMKIPRSPSDCTSSSPCCTMPTGPAWERSDQH